MNNLLDKFTNNEKSAAVIFLLPAMLGMIVFIIIPLFCSFGLSFTKWDLLNPIEYVGFKNYLNLINDKVFYKICLNTLTFAVSTSFFGVIIPLIFASVVNTKIRGSEFFKSACFIPFITPMVVIGVIWTWIFDPNIGFLNKIIGLHINWLYDTNFAMPALIIVSVWKLIGYNMIIFLSYMATIPQSLYEAAKIDGAGRFRTFTDITVPLLSPAILFVVIITVINSFQVFDLIFLMTEGGPFDSTNVIVYAIYKNAFEYFNVGKASAMAYVLFIVVLILTLIQWHFRKKIVYSEK